MTYTATVTSKGQVTLPKGIRQAYNIKTADKLIFEPTKTHIILQPINTDLMSLAGSIKVATIKPVNLATARRLAHQQLSKRRLSSK